MRAILVLIILFVFNVTSIVAQTGSLRTGIQSPNAASLGKYGEVPVNLYTGTPQISLPLFSDDSEKHTFPISLSYNSRGHQVEQIASWVGLGWSLNAGGVITRTVVGQPDEKAFGYYNTGDELYSGSNWTSPTEGFWQKILNKTVDTEPDKFFFNFNGNAGQLILPPKGIANSEIRAIPHQNIKIDFSVAKNEWTITTPDGVTYIFGGLGYVEVNTDFSASYPSRMTDNLGQTFTSSWFLKRVEWPNSNRNIQLQYRTYTARSQYRGYDERFSNRIVHPIRPCIPTRSSVRSEYEIKSLLLESILTPKYIIRFAKSPRSALPSSNEGSDEYKLDNIKVHTRAGDVVKEYQFSYSYTRGYKKLRLDRVWEVGQNGTTQPPYMMEYKSGSFPNPKQTNAIDMWGYYNGKKYNSTLIPALSLGSAYYPGADRTVDPEAIKLGMLERITYPTGGYTDFEFEANEYGSIQGDTNSLTGTNITTDELRSSSKEGVKTKTISFSTIDGQATTADVDVDIEDSCGSPMPGCPRAEVTWDGGAEVFNSNEKKTLSIPTDQVTIRVDPAYSGYVKVGIRLHEKTLVDKKLAGGLRIQSIATYPDQRSDPTLKTFSYKTLSDPSSPDRSSGVIAREPRFYYRFSGRNCSYLSRTSISKMPLGMTKGNTVGYNEVTVNYNGASQGKQVYKFTTAEDHKDLDQPVSSVWPFFNSTDRDWRRGLETSVQTFDANNNLLREVNKMYDFENKPSYREYRALAVNSVNSDYKVYHDYRVISEWMHIDSKTVIQVEPSNQSKRLTTTIARDFEDPSHLLPTKVTEINSDGTQRITEYTYAHEVSDDGTGGNYTPMRALHMLSQPYAVTVKDGAGAVLRTNWTLWGNSDGWWRPRSEWQWRSGDPEHPVFNKNN